MKAGYLNPLFAVVGGVVLAVVPHTQATILVQDDFGSAGGGVVLGSTTSVGGAKWIGNDFDRVSPDYTVGQVVASWAGNDTVIAVVALPSFGGVMSVSVDLRYSPKSTNSNGCFVGFSSVPFGSVNDTNAKMNGGKENQFFYGVLTTAGLGIEINRLGEGQLVLNGEGIDGTRFKSVSSWIAGAQNTVMLSLDSDSRRVTAFVGGVQVAATQLSDHFEGTYAGFAEFYGDGYSAGLDAAISFDNFAVTQSGTIPDPSTYSERTHG